ncbi:MAG: signal peptidase II [Gemmatimonas sp.]
MKAALFWPILLAVVLLDFFTKYLAVSLLGGVPHTVIGETIRLVLVYNPGAAFGFYLGEYSRWIFMALTLGALVILWRLYKNTAVGNVPRTVAVALVSAGAIGNLLDRIRTELGVVDFIDIGFGRHRWPTFNVADIAVSGGALLLAVVLWGEDKRAAAASANTPSNGASSISDVPSSTAASFTTGEASDPS